MMGTTLAFVYNDANTWQYDVLLFVPVGFVQWLSNLWRLLF